MLEMNPYLVGATGQKPAKHYTAVTNFFDDLKLGVRHPALIRNRHFFPMDRMAPDWLSDVTGFLTKHTATDSQVDLRDRSARELAA
jgi:hypothetical protein